MWVNGIRNTNEYCVTLSLLSSIYPKNRFDFNTTGIGILGTVGLNVDCKNTTDMGILHSDLKHQLYNVLYIDSCKSIDFPKPLKIKCTSTGFGGYHSFTSIAMVGRSIKILTRTDAYTLSNLPNIAQWFVTSALWSLKDPRHTFDWDKVYEVENLFEKHK